MRIEHIEIEKIVPFDRSPRKNDNAVDAVAKSIQSFGFNCPIVVDPGNRICAGHTRWKAAKKLRLKTVPVIKVDRLTGDKFLAFNIADNQTARLAQWQDDLLAEILDVFSNSAIDMDSLGFSEEELDARLNGNAEIDWGVEDDLLEEETMSRWTVIQLKFPAKLKSRIKEALAAKALDYGVKATDPAVASGTVVKILLGIGE